MQKFRGIYAHATNNFLFSEYLNFFSAYVIKNTDRFWAMDAGRSQPAWWQVDLEEPTTVGRVVVIGYYGDERHYGFTVETSLDGKQWDMVADHRNNKELSTAQGATCKFEPKKVRYIKVTQTSNSANTGRHLVEVMAYEK